MVGVKAGNHDSLFLIREGLHQSGFGSFLNEFHRLRKSSLVQKNLLMIVLLSEFLGQIPKEEMTSLRDLRDQSLQLNLTLILLT